MRAQHFSKIEGCGNHFIVIFDDRDQGAFWKRVSAGVQDRCFGLAADGLMVARAAEIGGRPGFSVAMYNPDGSASGMCGNGIRCVVRHLFLCGIVQATVTELPIDFSGRAVTAWTKDQGRTVRVDMGAPSFERERIPTTYSGDPREMSIQACGREFTGIALSMGNPHCVILVPDVDAVPLDQWGPAIESHPLFPARTNVEFVQVMSRDQLRMRVWERGAGPTLACGSGVCASTVAAILRGVCNRHVVVQVPGGRLSADWDTGSSHVHLEGPAREVARGELCEDFLERVSRAVSGGDSARMPVRGT